MDVRFREKFQDALAVVVSDKDRAGLDILTHGDYHCDEDLAGRAWHHYPVPEPVRIATRAGRVIVDGQRPVGNVQPACGLRTGGPRRPIRAPPDEARRCPGARGTSLGTCVGTGTWKVSWGQPLTKSPGRARRRRQRRTWIASPRGYESRGCKSGRGSSSPGTLSTYTMEGRGLTMRWASVCVVVCLCTGAPAIAQDGQCFPTVTPRTEGDVSFTWRLGLGGVDRQWGQVLFQGGRPPGRLA